MYYTYMLIDPRTQQPFYVGKGKGDRCRHHLDSRAKGENKRKDSLIENIRNENLEPLIKIIENFSDENLAYELEEKLISHFGRKGIDKNGILMNFCQSNRPPSHKGLKRSPETIEKLKNRKISDETKLKMSESQKGEKNTMYGKPGINLGKKFTDQHKENLKQSHLGFKHTKTSIQKMSYSKKGTTPHILTIEAAKKARTGLKLPKEWVEKTVAARIKNGSYKRSEDSIRKMNETRKIKKTNNPLYGTRKNVVSALAYVTTDKSREE